jgi:CNT family concentrative nucleoside transporter
MGSQDTPPAALPPMPLWWRWAIALGVAALALAAYGLRHVIGPRGQAAFGIVCFIGFIMIFSANLRAVNWRTVGWGIGLQVLLALLILKLEIGGYRPVYELFRAVAVLFKHFTGFAAAGARFVFGPLADPETLGKVSARKTDSCSPSPPCRRSSSSPRSSRCSTTSACCSSSCACSPAA